MTTKKENTTEPSRGEHSRRHDGLTAFMLIAIVMLAGGLIYVGTLNRSLKSADAQVAAISDTAGTIKKISNFIELPSDEKPTIARINDVEALKQTNPDFYAAAKNGDLLVVYTTMALIYRDSTDKLVKVAPVIIHENSSNSSGDVGSTQGGVDTPSLKASSENSDNNL